MDYRICRNKRPGRLIFRSSKKFQNPSNPIGFVYSPPLKNHPLKPIDFMYSPLWKITVSGGRLFRGGRLLWKIRYVFFIVWLIHNFKRLNQHMQRLRAWRIQFQEENTVAERQHTVKRISRIDYIWSDTRQTIYCSRPTKLIRVVRDHISGEVPGSDSSNSIFSKFQLRRVVFEFF